MIRPWSSILLLNLLIGGAASASAAEPDVPATSFPYTPGLDVHAMDRSADPCVNFYQYSCGGWQASNPIPPDQSHWSVYGKLYADNQRFLWGLLQSLASDPSAKSEDQQKIGDYFYSCMDEARVEALGAKPLLADIKRIDALQSKKELPMLLARLQQETGGRGFFFEMTSDQDLSDSSQVIAIARAGGLGLPDRDYYLKDDARAKALREQYLAHVENVFLLIGEKAAQAKRDADEVMAIETDLARASLTRVERRDPYNTFHNMTLAQMQQLTPSFHWVAYLEALGVPYLEHANITQPAFFREFSRQLTQVTLTNLKTYLKWQLIRAQSPYLSSAFVNEDFDFNSRILRGTLELRPRWKRCVSLVDEQMGDALGKEFVARTFSPALKQKTLRMTQQIEQAMAQEIQHLAWMTEATKAHALEKLAAVVNKIGYPDHWRDYGSLAIDPEDFIGNVRRGHQFESHREIAKIGKPLDRSEWDMSPPTVNAYYDAQLNDVNFPAGVLQPPLYDPAMDDAPNYGNTGGTIGHELTHGFDDEGRKYDAKGNLKDWWTDKDVAEFDKRTQCIVDQYSSYVVVDDIHINGKLTLGEDLADLGGLILARIAWEAQTLGETLEPRDCLTPEQRFFVGYAQWACENARPETLRLNAATDPHSPGKYRVNGLVVNMPEFEQAFSCQKGQPMTREDRCSVW